MNGRFHTQKLQNEIFKSKSSVELRDQFSLSEVEENVNEDCIQMATAYTETAEKVLSRVRKKSKQW